MAVTSDGRIGGIMKKLATIRVTSLGAFAKIC